MASKATNVNNVDPSSIGATAEGDTPTATEKTPLNGTGTLGDRSVTNLTANEDTSCASLDKIMPTVFDGLISAGWGISATLFGIKDITPLTQTLGY